MTVVDTSALMAILLGETSADACASALEADVDLLISAATVAEASIVARRRGIGEQMERLLGGLGMEVAPVTSADAHAVASAYERWGKGIHPAGLNLGDCFAYALAKREGAPLLFVGEDFVRTDIVPRLAG